MPTTLEWFGTATFRVRDAGLDLFFDAYLDRLPGLEPVGLTTAEVDKADFVFVSHAHFDHLYGVDAVALRTGATVVSSPESARCLRALGVPDDQLLVVTGGETVHCGPTTKVRVLPALHSCLFAHSEADTALPCLGDLGVERAGACRRRAGPLRRHGSGAPAGRSGARGHERGVLPARRRAAGVSADDRRGLGPRERQRGLLAWHLRRLRPDVALLSLGGRPNVDGEPFQGSSAQFMLEQVQLLRPGRVAFCHHDPLFPGLPGVDIGPAADALAHPAPPGTSSMEYASPVAALRLSL